MSPATVHEQCWDGCADVAKVSSCIRNGHPVMVLMRGVPGSGKSHLARQLLNETNGVILSTDDLFMENGIYKFDPAKLDEYHQKNIKDAKNAMLDGRKPVIVDNTNILMIHMKPYILQAVVSLYEIYFVEPQTAWKKTASTCAQFNTHMVSEKTISRMLESFESVSLENALKPVQLKLSPPMAGESDEETSTNSNQYQDWDGIKR
ncbi:hypothetical protein AB6A40_004411 [Gnathostoma spinigerum]|uniref:Uncharacterized protein n=1 Tax=Gnathostoma spinigerum TaxID=75299 RepID=A0ABD6ELV7_9BILA